MRLTMEQLEDMYTEMVENQEINKEAQLYCEHENAGDRE